MGSVPHPIFEFFSKGVRQKKPLIFIFHVSTDSTATNQPLFSVAQADRGIFTHNLFIQ